MTTHNHVLVYRGPSGAEITINIEWPDWASMTPPPEIDLTDEITGDTVTYLYNRTTS